MLISPISSVSTNAYRKTQFKKVQHNEKPQTQPQQPAFKGGNGFIAGYGAGAIGTLVAFGLTLATGGAAGLVFLGGMAASAGLGYGAHKAEDAIKKAIDDKNNK